jgi:hypothetical protein
MRLTYSRNSPAAKRTAGEAFSGTTTVQSAAAPRLTITKSPLCEAHPHSAAIEIAAHANTSAARGIGYAIT